MSVTAADPAGASAGRSASPAAGVPGAQAVRSRVRRRPAVRCMAPLYGFWPGQATCRSARNARSCNTSISAEVHPDVDAEDARLVDEARQVVEVDAALQVLLVGQVAREHGKLPLSAVRDVTRPQPQLPDRAGVILGRFVEEKVRVTLLHVIEEHEEIGRASGRE